VNAPRSPIESEIFEACARPENWVMAPMGGFLGVRGRKVRAALAHCDLPGGEIDRLVRAFETGAHKGFDLARERSQSED
jgi:hypothetical protein